MKDIIGLAAIGIGGYFLYNWYNSMHTPTVGPVTATGNTRYNSTQDISEQQASNLADRVQSRGNGMRGIEVMRISDLLYGSPPSINKPRQTTLTPNYGETLIMRGSHA